MMKINNIQGIDLTLAVKKGSWVSLLLSWKVKIIVLNKNRSGELNNCLYTEVPDSTNKALELTRNTEFVFHTIYTGRLKYTIPIA